MEFAEERAGEEGKEDSRNLRVHTSTDGSSKLDDLNVSSQSRPDRPELETDDSSSNNDHLRMTGKGF
jgi:hypothetical protein